MLEIHMVRQILLSQVFAPYLAIDIPSFVNDSECTDHQRSKINRLMDIWVDRALYDANFIQSIKSAFHVGNSYGAPNLTLDSFSRVSASAPQSSAVEPHHKAVSAPIPTPASPVTVQTNNSLVKLYMELEKSL
eukprot:TRINITY_DN5215_c0_g2_i1.p1 TRINITY_DN5215_c0_g2~~TRINITY_DN5215_c0_g2_i1.p1  ORF type:complete len:133 (-),score=32.96 TRINITY_DN5215_c0_g2_i1:365-763(-)